jgi:hypothetical protein
VIDRKARLREYKENPPPMGIYRITCTPTGNSVVGSARNVLGRLNRYRFELEFGGRGEQPLLADWRTFGADAFVFEVLDTLEPSDEPDHDPADELAVLEQMWREKLS